MCDKVSEKRIAIIGANGFLGTAIQSVLKNSGYAITKTSRNPKLGSGEETIQLDLFNPATWENLFSIIKPDIVICTAWETTHSKYWTSELNLMYMNYTKKFAEECFNKSVVKFIGIGSMSEYGYSPGRCNSKFNDVNPQDLYSESKVIASLGVSEIASNYGKKANWLRLFQPYGLNEKMERLIPKVINLMIDGSPISINYPEHQLDFTNANDIAKAVELIIEVDFEYYVDIGTGIPTSVRKLVEKLASIAEYKLKDSNFKSIDIFNERNIYVDSQAEIFLKGWSPLRNLSGHLDEYYKEFKRRKLSGHLV